MTYFNPIGNKPHDPFEKYYKIEYIKAVDEQHRRDEEEAAANQQPKNVSVIFYLLFLLRKIVQLLTQAVVQTPSKSVKKEIRENILGMDQCFKILMKEDRSQDATFLKELSQIWQKILEDSLRFKKTTPLMIRFKNFIKQIALYPEGEDHSFAYYLSEYAGKSWLPFPYMELIQNLHTQYEKNPTNNPLTKWTDSLAIIIVLLNQE